MNRRSSHVLPDKFKPTLEEIFVLPSPPIADHASVEIWIEARLFRATTIIITRTSDNDNEGGATYSAVSVTIAYSTVERITLGVPVCREVTMEICKRYP